jgi:hypothetical protein
MVIAFCLLAQRPQSSQELKTVTKYPLPSAEFVVFFSLQLAKNEVSGTCDMLYKNRLTKSWTSCHKPGRKGWTYTVKNLRMLCCIQITKTKDSYLHISNITVCIRQLVWLDLSVPKKIFRTILELSRSSPEC